MTNQKNGGQAFPRAGYDGPDNGAQPVDGMSLRDWFAGQALIMAGVYLVDDDAYPGTVIASDIAKRAYGIADAMLKAREA